MKMAKQLSSGARGSPGAGLAAGLALLLKHVQQHRWRRDARSGPGWASPKRLHLHTSRQQGAACGLSEDAGVDTSSCPSPLKPRLLILARCEDTFWVSTAHQMRRTFWPSMQPQGRCCKDVCAQLYLPHKHFLKPVLCNLPEMPAPGPAGICKGLNTPPPKPPRSKAARLVLSWVLEGLLPTCTHLQGSWELFNWKFKWMLMSAMFEGQFIMCKCSVSHLSMPKQAAGACCTGFQS